MLYMHKAIEKVVTNINFPEISVEFILKHKAHVYM